MSTISNNASKTSKLPGVGTPQYLRVSLQLPHL